MKRFDVLDSWRGVCACTVAFGHLTDATSSTLHGHFNFAIYLLVDFFFVMSGFLIAGAYERRVSDMGIGPFIMRRFGRLYPLHFATLGALVALEVALFLYPFEGFDLANLFNEEFHTWPSLLSNLALLHAMGLHEGGTWNMPSWSISVEFYTYLVFAGLWVLMLRTPKSARWMNVFYATLLVVCPLILLFVAPNGMDSIADFAFVRCLLGFAIGVLTWRVYERLKNWRAGSLPGGAAKPRR